MAISVSTCHPFPKGQRGPRPKNHGDAVPVGIDRRRELGFFRGNYGNDGGAAGIWSTRRLPGSTTGPLLHPLGLLRR